MLETYNEQVEAMLSRVVAACWDTEQLAEQLSRDAQRESLRQLLQERAASYRRTAHDLQDHGCDLGFVDTDLADDAHEARQRNAEVESIWEAVECSTLICLRDALDSDIPPEIGRIVRRSIEEGVNALERLRSLPRD